MVGHAVFFKAQDARRGLTPQEQSLEAASIEVSDNSATSALFAEVGGAPAFEGFGRSIGMTGTAVNRSWALTTTTAADQVTLLRAFATPNPVLSTDSRNFGLNLLAHVEPSQAFGISTGLPPGVVRAVETGRLPYIGVSTSIGWIDGAGRNYLIAVLVGNGPSDPYSVATESAVTVSAFDSLGP